MGDSHSQHRLIYVGGYDMKLLRQIRRFAYNVVLSVADVADQPFRVGKLLKLHDVAHSNWVSAFDSFDTEIAFDLALPKVAALCTHNIAAACISENYTFHPRINKNGGDNATAKLG